MKIEKKTTGRGFSYVEFKDRYGSQCSLQKSSLASEDAIWLGIDDPNPQIMANQAIQLGVKTNEISGWIPYPIPEEVMIDTRMHLTQEQVKDLIPILQKFVDTGKVEL